MSEFSEEELEEVRKLFPEFSEEELVRFITALDVSIDQVLDQYFDR